MSTNEINMILNKLDELTHRIESMERALLGRLENGGSGLLAQCTMHRSRTKCVEEEIESLKQDVATLKNAETRRNGIVYGATAVISVIAWFCAHFLAKLLFK